MKNNKIELKVIKIGFLGDSTVGKTALCNSLLNLDFTEDMLMSVGVDKLETKYRLKNGNEIKMILWDTAGQERFRSIALKAIKSVNGIVIVFDYTKKSTFDNIDLWLSDIRENFENPCLVLFGNKIDLPKDRWQVTPEEVKKYAEKKKLVFFETSAKTKQGVNEGFSYIANESYNKAIEKYQKNIDIEEETEKPSSGCFGSKKKKNKSAKNKKK